MPRRPATRATARDHLTALALTACVVVGVLVVAARVRSCEAEREYAAASRSAGSLSVSDGEADAAPPHGGDVLNLPVVSPDERQIAFLASRGERSGLWRAGAGGEAPTLLNAGPVSRDSRPTWSPDGAWLAWLTPTGLGEGRLRIVSAKSGQPAPSPTEATGLLGAGVSWLPGTSDLLRVEPGSRAVVGLRLAADGSCQELLEPLAFGVECSPSGPGLRISSGPDGLFAWDDTSRHRLTARERIALLEWVEPSPDGEAIALIEAPHVPNTTVVEIALAPAGWEARERYRRGAPSRVDTAPRPGWLAWSPDSTWVLFAFAADGPAMPVGLFRDDGAADAVILDRDDPASATTLHWPGSASEHRACWLDPDTLLYLERGPETSAIWSVDWRTGKARRLVALEEVGAQ